MWIPEPGVRFRIMSSRVNKMFCQGSGKTPVGGIQLGECDSKTDYSYYDGSWWTLAPSRVSGFYLFIHLTSNSRLYVNNERHEHGMISTKYYQHNDQLWRPVPKNDESEDFQMVSYHQGQKLYFRDHASPHIGLCAGNTFDYSDQFFHLFFEEPTVKSVNFMINSAKMLGKCPKLLTQETFRNNSSVTQQNKITATYTQSKSHRWAYTGGFKISASSKLTFSAGIPAFGSAGSELTLGMETSHEWTTEDVTTESKSMSYEFPVSVSPNKAVIAKVVIHEERGEVPFEMVLQFNGSKRQVKSHGKWYGVQSVHVYRDIDETDL